MSRIRVVVSLTLFVLISLLFLDFAGVLPKELHVLGMIQLVPALLALNGIIVVSLLVLTLVFGRVYCSSVCPMGVYQDIVSWLRKKTSSKKKKKRYKYLKPLTFMRWSFTAAVVIAFLFGSTFLLGLLDPYSAFGRMSTHLFKPVYLAGNNLLAAAFSGGTTFYKVGIYLLSLSSTLVALVTMLTVGILAWRNGRIYCNTVCPVGTVLGVFSKYSLFRIRFDEEKCNLCGTCARNCKASCIDFKHMTVDSSRCINCFNCVDVCSESGLKYRLPFPKKVAVKPEITDNHKNSEHKKPGKRSGKTVDEKKRQFLTTLALTGWAATQLKADKIVKLGARKDVKRQQPIMPPGAGDIEKFSQKCTSCHLCVSKCPSQVIKPSFLEYGIGGMMQPMLHFDDAFCNYSCTVCADVCPSGALTHLAEEEKRHNQMGIVQLYLENCIVYTDNTNCGACSEHCPTQAVSMVPYHDNLTIPEINQEICVGCGGCESICPAKPFKAIFVEGITTHRRIEIQLEKVEAVEVDDFGF